jgi:hypothetical protein
MAKDKTNKEDMVGPLYTKPDANNLGPHKVEGPRGGLATPDPIGFAHGQMRHGPGGEKRTQKYTKE